MPEAEIRLGKACTRYSRPFRKKTESETTVQKSWLSGDAAAGLRRFGRDKGSVITRSMSLQPHTAGCVRSAPDCPIHSRKEKRHPPGIRNSPAATAHAGRTAVEQRHQLHRRCSSTAQIVHQEFGGHSGMHQALDQQYVLVPNRQFVAEENL